MSEILTSRQQRWFASVLANLERDTGRSLAEWAVLARACPEIKHRARLAWMATTYGLAQNRASLVLAEAFPPDISWKTPDDLADTLWAAPAPRLIFEALRDMVLELPDVVVGQRRGFTAFSRRVQFAAARPARQGVLLGLALGEDAPPRRESWSERLKTTVPLHFTADVNDLLRDKLVQAHAKS